MGAIRKEPNSERHEAGAYQIQRDSTRAVASTKNALSNASSARSGLTDIEIEMFISLLYV